MRGKITFERELAVLLTNQLIGVRKQLLSKTNVQKIGYRNRWKKYEYYYTTQSSRDNTFLRESSQIFRDNYRCKMESNRFMTSYIFFRTTALRGVRVPPFYWVINPFTTRSGPIIPLQACVYVCIDVCAFAAQSSEVNVSLYHSYRGFREGEICFQKKMYTNETRTGFVLCPLRVYRPVFGYRRAGGGVSRLIPMARQNR